MGIKKRFLQNLFVRFKKQEAILHELRYLFWECTLRCTLNCLHCGSDCRSDSHQVDMPAEDFLNVLRGIKESEDPTKIMVVITGGEPLLRKDLPDIGREIRKLGFRWGIVSNAFQYTPEKHRALMATGMGAITISLDGLEENHNWLRNSPLSYQRAIAAINLITKESRLNYDIVTCVHKRNIGELPDLMNILSEKGVKAWRLFTIAPIGRASSNDELALDPYEMKSLMDFIKDNRKRKQIDIKFSCEGFVGVYENEVRDGFFFCRAGINIGSVLADGSISACPNVHHSFIQGNIYKNDFMEIWNSRFKVMRDRSWTKNGECSQCDSYKYCQGNGLHLQNPDTGQVMQCHHKLMLDATSTISH